MKANLTQNEIDKHVCLKPHYFDDTTPIVEVCYLIGDKWSNFAHILKKASRRAQDELHCIHVFLPVIATTIQAKQK